MILLHSPFRLALLSGVLLSLAFPPLEWWWLGWFALAPLLLAVRMSTTSIQARICGFLTGLIAYPLILGWMWHVWWVLAIFAWWVLAVFLALASGFLKRWEMNREISWWGWCLAAGCAWFVVEVFRAELWPLRFGMGSLGYSQVPSLEFRQWVSWVGVYGLSLLMVVVNAGWALGWERFLQRQRGWARPLAGSILGVVVLGFGGHRLGQVKETGTLVVVAVVQDEKIDLSVHERLSREMTGSRSASVANGATTAKGAPDFVVWPEYGVELTPSWRKEATDRMGRLAQELRTTLVAGCMTFVGINAKKKFENHTLVFGPDGQINGRYTKMHPVQFIEGLMIQGTDATVIRTEKGVIGTPICYDMDYTDVVRKLSLNGAQLFLTPIMDPLIWGKVEHFQRLRIAQMRAVESRRWVGRATSSGISAIIDPRAPIPHIADMI